MAYLARRYPLSSAMIQIYKHVCVTVMQHDVHIPPRSAVLCGRQPHGRRRQYDIARAVPLVRYNVWNRQQPE